MFILAFLLACASDPKDTASIPIFPSVEDDGGVTVLRVGGTPYDMGHQQGELLRESLLEGGEWLEESELALAEPLADYYGLLDEARDNSYPAFVDECQGLVDAVDDPLWTMDRCLLLAYGDVVMEWLSQKIYGCSQFVVTGPASADGRLIHGRNLDWSDIPFIIEHPTLIVRFPEDGIPWVAFGFPGNISPYSGMNAHGLALLSNEAYGSAMPDRQGHAHTQMMKTILESATSLDEARAFFLAEDHTSAEIVVVSDGVNGTAAVFEMATDGMAVRDLPPSGSLYATNYFIDPSMQALQEPEEKGSGSVSRYDRLAQLVDSGGERYGKVDIPGAVDILRDTYNPWTDVESSPDLFDGGGSLANNGAIQSMVFVPEERWIYLAHGPIPVPQGPFQGFSLDALLGEAASGPDPLGVE